MPVDQEYTPTPASRRSKKTTKVGPGRTTETAPDLLNQIPVPEPIFQTEEAALSTTAAPTRRANDPGRKLQSAFLLAALAGFITALVGLVPQVSWIGFAGPLLTIVGFYWWGHHFGLDDRGDTRQRFADSCYFLGFLLTMCAMLIGFFPSGMLGHELTSQAILRHFSMALGATALGLVFRIIALQGGRSLDEDVAEVEAELRTYAQKVTREAQAIGAELEAARSALGANVLSFVEVVGSQAPAAFSQMLETMRGSAREISRELANQAAELRGTAASVADNLTAQTIELREIESRSADAQHRLEDSIGATATAVTSLSSSLMALHSQIASAVSEATGAISAVSSSFEAASQRLPSIEQGVANLSVRVESAGREVSSIQSSMNVAAASAAEVAVRAQDISTTLEQGEKNVLAAFAAAADKVGDRAAAATEASITRMHQQIDEGLREGVEKLRDSVAAASEGPVAKVHQQMDERLRASTERLDPLRERTEALERSIADATTRLVAVVDRFSQDLADLRREAETL